MGSEMCIRDRASGRREGERNGKLEMARKMIRDKMPIEKVVEYSGLSVEEIKKLIG